MSEWKLVPMEPTPEMIHAGWKNHPSAWGDVLLPPIYKAMIDASPSAPAGQAEGAEDPRWWSPPDSFAKDWLTNGAALHPHTVNLVVRFARALAKKLAAAEVKYGYSDGWRSDDWMDECRAKLIEHVAKGDPRDVAAYCAFLWHHGESTASLPPVVQQAPVQPADDFSGVDPVLMQHYVRHGIAPTPQPAAQSAVTDEQIDAATQKWQGSRTVAPAQLVMCREYARMILALAS